MHIPINQSFIKQKRIKLNQNTRYNNYAYIYIYINYLFELYIRLIQVKRSF